MESDRRKVYLPIVIIVLVFVTAFNIYMHMNKNVLADERVEMLEKELLIMEAKLKEKDKEFNSNSVDSIKEIRESDEGKIINSTKRFIEFIYDNQAENYVIRKKDALNYMNEEMVQMFFPSDNAIENNKEVVVSDIEVYAKKDILDEDNSNKTTIVTYKLNVSLEENIYSEPLKVYMEVSLEEDNNTYKVSNIREFGNEGVMAYE